MSSVRFVLSDVSDVTNSIGKTSSVEIYIISNIGY